MSEQLSGVSALAAEPRPRDAQVTPTAGATGRIEVGQERQHVLAGCAERIADPVGKMRAPEWIRPMLTETGRGKG